MKIGHALKEWAAVTAAVGAGDQLILVRKGGIAEKRFALPADRFLLMPTQFHQGENRFRAELAHYAAAGAAEDLGNQVEFRVWCEVAQVFRVSDLDRLLALEPWVIFTSETIRDRYQFRPREAMHVLAVRAHRLERPVRRTITSEMLGCKSWIELPEPVEVADSEQVIAEDQLVSSVEALAAALTV